MTIAVVKASNLARPVGLELVDADVQPGKVGGWAPPVESGPPGDLGDGRLGGAIRSPQPEAPFVEGLVEGRPAVEAGHVVGEAPEERTGATVRLMELIG